MQIELLLRFMISVVFNLHAHLIVTFSTLSFIKLYSNKAFFSNTKLVNHTGHMIKAKLDILKSIPDDEFRGLAVIDWESWVPIFDRNMHDNRQKVYIKSSELLVEKQHPDWNFTRIEDEARIQFQSAARFVNINKANQLREL